MPDNWKHRADGMRCKTCMFFVPKVKKFFDLCQPRQFEVDPRNIEASPKEIKRPDTIDLGRCRRHAPTMGGFPVVFVNDWCGDHKLDEEKL